MAQFGRALRSGRRGRVFKSRRLDHTNRFVKPIEACRAVSFFIYAVIFCYILLEYRNGSFEWCTGLMRWFYVPPYSLFYAAQFLTSDLWGTHLYPHLYRYLVKHGVPVLKSSVIQPLRSPGSNRPLV